MAQPSDKVNQELVTVRDTVESIWIAIILAFILRAFMIEAFVIPTGSMAPRLVGEHYELTCPACGYEYDYGMMGQLRDEAGVSRSRKYQVVGAYCPTCNYPFPSENEEFIRSGDRVLVMKYLYRLADPQPWDVVVFRNPQNNRENYIKRLIGLPGETIEIVHGDIFVKSSPQADWQIRRKPRQAQNAMWQIVYDNDYQPDRDLLQKAGMSSPHWVTGSSRWSLSGDYGRQFSYSGAAPATSDSVQLQAARSRFRPRYGYNNPSDETHSVNNNIDVCGDLKLYCVYTPRSPDSSVTLLLSAMNMNWAARVSAAGQADLLYQGKVLKSARLDRPLESGSSHELSLEQVDLSIRLVVDGREVVGLADGYPETYQSLKQKLATIPILPTPELSIAASGGPCQLTHVKLFRDVYYTSSQLGPDLEGVLGEYARRLGYGRGAGWGTINHPLTLKKRDNADLDEFFVLGDNSPQSLDSRAWLAAAPSLRLYQDAEQKIPLYQPGTVPRYNMIGRAFFVYWPAGFRTGILPGLPIVPNVGKMRLIH